MTERNYREEDEREEFLSLRAGERRAICFILDMSKEHQASFVRWKDVYHSGLIMAASDIFSHMDGKAARIVHAAKYGLDDELYGFVLPVSRFLFLNDLVRSFVGMTFASVRLFGGEIRPYACSIYLA